MKIKTFADFENILGRAMVTVALFSSPDIPESGGLSLYIEDVLDEIGDPRVWDCEIDMKAFPGLAVRYRVDQAPAILIIKRGSETARFVRKPWKKRIIGAIRDQLEPFDFESFRREISKWN